MNLALELRDGSVRVLLEYCDGVGLDVTELFTCVSVVVNGYGPTPTVSAHLELKHEHRHVEHGYDEKLVSALCDGRGV